MKIDLQKELLLTLGEACRPLPKRPSPSTLWRWRTIGVSIRGRKIKLECIRSGGRGTWRKLDYSRNLAAGKPVTASSEEGTNIAKCVTDPKTYEDYVNAHWDCAASESQWICVDLGAATEVNRVILKWNAAAAKEFKLQTSTDGDNWTDAFSTSQGSSSMVTDETFKTKTARFVRMYATQRAPVLAGRRRGRIQSVPTTPPATQPASEPSRPSGYSLFDFMIFKD